MKKWLLGTVEKAPGEGYIGWLWGREYFSRHGHVWHVTATAKDAFPLVWFILDFHIREEKAKATVDMRMKDRARVYGGKSCPP